MTISVTTNRAQYNGNGVTTEFSFPFKIFKDTELKVYLNDNTTPLSVGTDYTITDGSTENSGSITTTATYTASDTITILHEPALTQETDYVEGDAFHANTHENSLDRVVAITQRLKEVSDRSLVFPKASTFVGVTFPDLVANKALKVNAAGDGLEFSTDDFNTIVTSSSAAQTAAEAAQAAAEAAQALAESAKTNAETAETNAATSAAEAAASAASINLPSLTGNASNALLVNGTEDGYVWTDLSALYEPLNANLLDLSTSANLTTGFTTDKYTITAASSQATYNVDITSEVIQEVTIDGDWTIARGVSTKAGRAIIRATVDATGGYTFAYTNIKLLSGTFDMTANAVNYIEYTQWDNTSDAVISVSQGV